MAHGLSRSSIRPPCPLRHPVGQGSDDVIQVFVIDRGTHRLGRAVAEALLKRAQESGAYTWEVLEALIMAAPEPPGDTNSKQEAPRPRSRK